MVQHLKGLCKTHSPNFLFIMGTKNKSRVVKKMLNNCGFVDMVFIDPHSLSRGLAFAWK